MANSPSDTYPALPIDPTYFYDHMDDPPREVRVFDFDLSTAKRIPMTMDEWMTSTGRFRAVRNYSFQTCLLNCCTRSRPA